MTARSHPWSDYLLKVKRPQQYTGGEWNLCLPAGGKPRITLVYPDIYELGMSNFGLSILRELLISSGRFDVRRAFAPAPDMDGCIEREGLDWVDLDRWEPVSRSSVVGFSIPSESLYTNVLHLIDLMGLPMRSHERSGDAPIVIMGGGGLANPLPLSPFADLFFLGEIEEKAVELFSVLTGEGERRELLKRASDIPGVFVPFMDDKRVEFQRAKVLDMASAPVRQLVPVSRVSQDRAVVEIARGCTRGCRFCQASQLYRPVRERPVEDVLEIMDRILSATGWEKAGVLTLSLSDYSRLDELLQGLKEVARSHHAALSRPSMRPDSIARMGRNHEVTGRVTIAPEAGTEELRTRINKPMKDSTILEAVNRIFRMGAKGVKLYFMIGIPGETEDDVRAIGKLALRIAGAARENGMNPRKSVNVALSPFVPKAQTPLQWAPQMEESLVWERIKQVRRTLRRKVQLTWNSPRVAMVEALLSLGDEGDTADMLQEAVEAGARFDAWGDRFRWDIWKEVLNGHPELVKRLRRGIPLDEPLPWDSLSTGVSEDFLKREYRRFKKGIPTLDCRNEKCSECGACTSKGCADGE